jgi:BirA family biotin operon repressor/biotin-[acetyl-CoA-carboxylase] ligase
MRFDTNSELLDAPSRDASGAEILLAERQTGGARAPRLCVRASPWPHTLIGRWRAASAVAWPAGRVEPGRGRVAVAEALRGLRLQRRPPENGQRRCDRGPAGLRKLGGLLIEGSGEHAGPARAVIGLGLNVRMPPARSGHRPALV